MQPTTPLAEERSPAPQPHTLCGDPAVGPPCSQPRRGETGNMTARPHWQAASQGVRRHTTVGVVPCPSISTNKKKRRPHHR